MIYKLPRENCIRIGWFGNVHPMETLPKRKKGRIPGCKYVRHHPRLQERLFEIYLEGHMTFAQMSKAFDIPKDTITHMSWRNKWFHRRQALLKKMQDDYVHDETQMAIEHRPKIMNRHIQITQMIDEVVEKQLIKLQTAKDLPMAKLTDIAKAMKASSDIANRAVGKPASGGNITIKNSFRFGVKPIRKANHGPGKTLEAESYEPEF